MSSTSSRTSPTVDVDLGPNGPLQLPGNPPHVNAHDAMYLEEPAGTRWYDFPRGVLKGSQKQCGLGRLRGHWAKLDAVRGTLFPVRAVYSSLSFTAANPFDSGFSVLSRSLQVVVVPFHVRGEPGAALSCLRTSH